MIQRMLGHFKKLLSEMAAVALDLPSQVYRS